MTAPSVESRLARSLLRAILDESFSEDECRLAAQLLRQGGILNLVASTLDLLAGSAKNSDPVKKSPKEPSQASLKSLNPQLLPPPPPGVPPMFDLIKRRKITKNALLDMLRNVNPTAVPRDSRDLTIRELLSYYRSTADDRDWALLEQIIAGNSDSDPFLRQILDR